ncbi:serine hydrolase domain-containing protein [Chitinimonas sp. JJ19]|uniref:serine hydrolase domain-containing protein n=1 Tax=Chitinimonas sp. JJ19 TaxID=3109352 RepID=UPI002FFF44EB
MLKLNRRNRLGGVLLALLLNVGAMAADVGRLTQALQIDAQAIDAHLKQWLQARQIPGAALAIVERGEVRLLRSYGLANVEHQVPVRPETVFQSGSVGKQMTAVAVMLLVQDGKLKLDDKLARHLPQVPASWRNMTVRHLLTHTSGLPEDWPEKFDYRRDYSEPELARYIMGMPLQAKPGERWQYSNPGYVLLGVLVSKLAGQFYGDFLQQRVFMPLGMDTARVISERDIVPHRAAGYQLIDGRLKNQDWVSPTLNTTADGSLYVGLQDMIKWDASLRNATLLTPEHLAELWQPVRLNNGKRHPYGLGWELGQRSGREWLYHDGAWQGFESYAARYRDGGLSLVVLLNRSDAGVVELADGLMKLLEPAATTP